MENARTAFFLLGLLPAALRAAPGDLDPLRAPAPAPLRAPHFPRPLDEYVFRNWGAVTPERIAAAIGARVEDIRALAREMGLGEPPAVTSDVSRRSYLTVIRRNWHLLPYEQLLALLGWDEATLAYILREDDFLWIKMGSLKPACPPISFEPLPEALAPRMKVIRETVQEVLGAGGLAGARRRFAFLDELAGTQEMPRPTVEKVARGEVDLSHGSRIAIPAGAGEIVRGAAERFSAFLAAGLGAVPPAIGPPGGAAPGRAGAPLIDLVIDPRAFEKPESHEVIVEPGLVKVSARDEVGILRGLDRLRDRLTERGGPFLAPGRERRDTRFGLRFLYSYFALYGDPLLEPDLDPYPDGYLEKLARRGVNGVWLQAVLRNLAPQPAAGGSTAAALPFPEFGAGSARRLENLRALVARAKRFGIGIYLYLNEPRAMASSFFRDKPEVEGVGEGDLHALCTSAPRVRDFLSGTLAHVFAAVPDLAGVFTISMSENLTSCWSHQGGKGCPRCGARPGPEVVAEVNRAVLEGVRRSSATARVIVWDWGWPDDWVGPIAEKIPAGIDLMSVSEWSLPIRRGGIDSTVGEYSISAVGPGPRARKTWEIARRLGRPAIAKVQVNNTWELSSVPYIPAVGLVAEHVSRLASEGVDGLMLSWTLGGYPSPNLEAAAEFYFGAAPEVDQAVRRVAARRFGPGGEKVAASWKTFGEAFAHFPYGLGLYTAPLQFGPSNLLHPRDTGYRATMIGFPYDDLESWRGVYPAEVLAGTLDDVAQEWARGLAGLRDDATLDPQRRSALSAERRVAMAAWIHFRSVAAQSRFVLARRAYQDVKERGEALKLLDRMRGLLLVEIDNARKLLTVVREDARLGFEASNHYYYLPGDLVEKVINCRWLLEDWIAAEKKKWGDER
jgi:hypothetical protein